MSQTGTSDVEVLEGEPVVEDVAPLPEPRAAASTPQTPFRRAIDRLAPPPEVAQAAAVAVTGVAAGVLASAAVRHAKQPRRKRTRGSSRRNDGLPIVATRRYVVDVHLLGE